MFQEEYGNDASGGEGDMRERNERNPVRDEDDGRIGDEENG